MNKKTVSISLPQIEGIELKNATVDLEKGVLIAEYGEEEREKDISEMVINVDSARDYLDIDIFDETFDDKLDALRELMTIAKAWNSFDEFKPDWDDLSQCKYYPLFIFESGKFEFSSVAFSRFISYTHTSSFSFKTPERAEQFGKQFIGLFRIALAN